MSKALFVHPTPSPTTLSPQAARAHCSSARLEIDLYRRTHIFPFRAFWRVEILARSLLSAVTVLLYPLQPGKLDLSLVHAHGDLVRAIGRDAQSALGALADCLELGVSVAAGLEALRALHRSTAALLGALRALPSDLALAPAGVALHVTTTNLLAATAQVGVGG